MKTQAWGWLTVAVLAAGLNASYHDGGMEWAHHIVGRVGHNAAAVLALASGNADQFLMEARHITTRTETPSCPFTSAIAEAESGMAQSQAQWDRFDAMSAREQAKLARFEANRARVEAELAAKASQIRFATVNFDPSEYTRIQTSVCPRIRVNIPRIPTVRIPSPMVHVEVSGPGPV